jgi:SAM-dependent methyltransferase
MSVPATALRFGSVAELYERARPAYPEELIDVVLDYGALGPGDRALDLGTGTGQATMQLAERGLQVTALEPGAEMVSLANDKFAAAGVDARAVVGGFESAPLDPAASSLVLAATSWHWLDPAVRMQRAASALRPGGTLAVMWTWPRWRATTLCADLDEIYADSGAPAEMGPMLPVEPDPQALAAEWLTETQASGRFDAPHGRLCTWSLTYTAAGYTELLGTYRDHFELGPDVLEPPLGRIGDAIERAGGTLELPYRTLLLLARLA